MSRVLKRSRQTLDYALWEKVRGNQLLLSSEQGEYLAERDRGDSNISDFFQKDGRVTSDIDDTKVYDFISLSSSFDPWFDRLRLDKQGLLDEIQNSVMDLRGAQTYFDGIEEQWVEIDWGTLGRVIGAAVANIGSSEGWWKTRGRDAQMSLNFWGELDREIPRVSDGQGLKEQKWNDLAVRCRERRGNFDPNSEILRAFSHRPSAPFLVMGDIQSVTYHPNPLALLHRKRLQELYGSYGNREDWEPLEIAKFHGKLTMELINRAMVYLSKGNYAEFAIRIHGICALHIMRTFVRQQKIGLHLITNLAIRKQTRGVGAQNVPDIAYHLGTGFHLAKVLHILQRSKLIDWYTVDKEIVDKAREEIS
jgi:hypothetical protein